MSSVPDLEAEILISRIENGELPREFIMYAAKGFLPLPQEDLVAVTAYLSTHADPEIRDAAGESLREIPPQDVLSFARSEKSSPRLLGNLALAVKEAAVLEALIRNRATTDQTVVELARTAAPAVQEVIVINQERILRSPALLEALLENPRLTLDVKRRALETREEFFEKKQRREEEIEPQEELDEEQEAPLDIAAVADLLQAAEQAEDQPISPDAGAGVEDGKGSIWREILNMSVADRVKFAYKGGKTARGILIRDRNKLVCSAVMRSPRLTDSEVDSYASMRNLDEEVLRLIGNNREYMNKYSIMLTLIRNPKAPIGVVLPLVNRLTLKDLKGLAIDRNVSEAVRVSARKLFLTRSQRS